jgi:hypothetical protein
MICTCFGLYAGLLPKKPDKPKTLDDHLKSIAKRGGEARMKSLSATERSQLATKGGKTSGTARAVALTADERSRIARKAALEMWRKRRAKEETKDS